MMHPTLALLLSTAAISLLASPESNLVALADVGHGHSQRRHGFHHKRRNSVDRRSCKARAAETQVDSTASAAVEEEAVATSSEAATTSKAIPSNLEVVAFKTSAAPVVSSTAVPVVSTSEAEAESAAVLAVQASSTIWGLAYADGPYNGVLKNHWVGGKIGWYYNWRSMADDGYYYGNHEWITAAPETFNYVPQLWGMENSKVAQFWNQSAYWPKQGVTHLLGFNEPDQSGQSNIKSGKDGANYWAQTVGTFKGKYTLVSPACTSSPASWKWIGDFLAAGAKPDVIAIHWYGVTFEDFANYTTGFHKAFNKPIWVTEIACTDFVGTASCSSIPGFMNKLAAYAASNTWLQRIAWYGALDLEKSNGYGAVAAGNGLCKNQDCASGRSSLGNQYFNGGW